MAVSRLQARRHSLLRILNAIERIQGAIGPLLLNGRRGNFSDVVFPLMFDLEKVGEKMRAFVMLKKELEGLGWKIDHKKANDDVSVLMPFNIEEHVF
jgi:hypothetical protein